MLHDENLMVQELHGEWRAHLGYQKDIFRKGNMIASTFNDVWIGRETWSCFGLDKENRVFVFTRDIQSIQLSTL